MLLKSNQTNFVQFGNKLAFASFKKVQITFAQRAHAVLILFEKPTNANLFPNRTLSRVITNTNSQTRLDFHDLKF